MKRKKWTQREWDRVVGIGRPPKDSEQAYDDAKKAIRDHDQRRSR